MSGSYTHEEQADLVLHDVAFARLSEGRLAARGTAKSLEYRRAGGRLTAADANAAIDPDPGTGIARLGTLRLSAPQVEGEVGARRGRATGGVRVTAARGDVANARSLEWEGAGQLVRSDEPVSARGPGYSVTGQALVAKDDGSRIDLIKGAKGRVER